VNKSQRTREKKRDRLTGGDFLSWYVASYQTNEGKSWEKWREEGERRIIFKVEKPIIRKARHGPIVPLGGKGKRRFLNQTGGK